MIMYLEQFELSSCSPIGLMEWTDAETSMQDQTPLVKNHTNQDDTDIIQSFIPVEEIWHIQKANQ